MVGNVKNVAQITSETTFPKRFVPKILEDKPAPIDGIIEAKEGKLGPTVMRAEEYQHQP